MSTRKKRAQKLNWLLRKVRYEKSTKKRWVHAENVNCMQSKCCLVKRNDVYASVKSSHSAVLGIWINDCTYFPVDMF